MRHRETDNYVAVVIKGDHFLETSNHIVVAYRGLVKPTGWCNTRCHESVRGGARVKKAPDVRAETTLFFLLSSICTRHVVTFCRSSQLATTTACTSFERVTSAPASCASSSFRSFVSELLHELPTWDETFTFGLYFDSAITKRTRYNDTYI